MCVRIPQPVGDSKNTIRGSALTSLDSKNRQTTENNTNNIRRTRCLIRRMDKSLSWKSLGPGGDSARASRTAASRDTADLFFRRRSKTPRELARYCL